MYLKNVPDDGLFKFTSSNGAGPANKVTLYRKEGDKFRPEEDRLGGIMFPVDTYAYWIVKLQDEPLKPFVRSELKKLRKKVEKLEAQLQAIKKIVGE